MGRLRSSILMMPAGRRSKFSLTISRSFSFESLPVPKVSTFMDLGGNTCSLFSRSAVMNGKNKVFALNSDAEAVQLIPSVSSAATAPAFVIC